MNLKSVVCFILQASLSFALSCKELKLGEKNCKENNNEVTELVFNNTPMASISNVLFNITSLEKLTINRAYDIFKIPDEIDSFPKLKYLDLSWNKIKDIPNSIFNLKNLEELNLKYNEITSISDKLENLENLKKIYFHWNYLEKIPDSIFKLKKLEEIYLGQNKITSLPDKFEEIYYLKKLDLSYNKIDSLPNSIYKLKHLEQIDLKHNFNLIAIALTNPNLKSCNYEYTKNICKPRFKIDCGNKLPLCQNAERKCGIQYGKCYPGQCCNKEGYCGITSDYCDKDCQSEFGKCN